MESWKNRLKNLNTTTRNRIIFFSVAAVWVVATWIIGYMGPAWLMGSLPMQLVNFIITVAVFNWLGRKLPIHRIDD